jgi:hypothetical protein
MVAEMENIARDAEWSSISFWTNPPPLPHGLSLRRAHAFRAALRTGPGGQDFFEEAVLETPTVTGRLLVAFKASLTAKEVPSLKRRLQVAINAIRSESRQGGHDPLIPVVATDHAQPAVLAACEREWLGLVDQDGNVSIRNGGVFVHVLGVGKKKRRLRASPFRGKSTRILRLLLNSPGQFHYAKAIAEHTDTSFAYAYAVLTRLEEDGFVDRRTPRTGFRLVRPLALLDAWVEEGAPSAIMVEPFHAPSTSAKDLEVAANQLRLEDAPFAFTLLSAVASEKVIVGGLPHGIYLNGDASVLIDALRLKKVTPHNFLILRPHAAESSTPYGVFREGRSDVATPQLVRDLITFGGPRGLEQAELLKSDWASTVELASEIL